MGCSKVDQTNVNQANLYHRVKKLLVSFDWSDCSFSVSGRDFKAHKLLLGISSPVFEAMFYGPLSNNDKIVITDIEPDIFQLILNYIYTDSVEISSIEKSFELLYASKKYLLEHLSTICISYIQANISVDNVVEVLNYPDFMQDKELVSFALKLFCEHADYLFEEKLQNITSPCLKIILESEQMNLPEKDLIKHIFNWSVLYCRENEISPTFENRRKMLNEFGLFKLLRFATLSLHDLMDIVTDKSNLIILSELEALKKVIKHNISDNDIDSVDNIMVTPRKSLSLHWYVCYRSPLRSVAPITIDSDNYIINSRIKSNKSLFIKSLCVPSRMAPAVHFRNTTTKVYSEQLSVSLVCESDSSIIKFTNFMNTVEYGSIVNIELNEPCLIKKDTWYKISFVWPHNRGQTYSYVVEYRDRIYTGHKITFEFDDLPLVTGNGGSFLSGLKFCL